MQLYRFQQLNNSKAYLFIMLKVLKWCFYGNITTTLSVGRSPGVRPLQAKPQGKPLMIDKFQVRANIRSIGPALERSSEGTSASLLAGSSIYRSSRGAKHRRRVLGSCTRTLFLLDDGRSAKDRKLWLVFFLVACLADLGHLVTQNVGFC